MFEGYICRNPWFLMMPLLLQFRSTPLPGMYCCVHNANRELVWEQDLCCMYAKHLHALCEASDMDWPPVKL
jgi:hypothetical protein